MNCYNKTNMIKKLVVFFCYPFSIKMKIVNNLYLRYKCALFGKIFSLSWGKCSTIDKAIFCSYEHLHIGNNVTIGKHARIETINKWQEAIFYPEIIIGNDVSIGQRLTLVAGSKLVIGNACVISYDVTITDIDHEYKQINVGIAVQPLIINETKIGDGCFIGSGVKILAGTKLGEHCIVGANSIVRGQFPDHCVLVGSPAKIIKKFNNINNIWEKV